MKFQSRTVTTVELDNAELTKLRIYLADYLRDVRAADPGPTVGYVSGLAALVDQLDDADTAGRC